MKKERKYEPQRVYHYTKLKNLISILEQDCFILSKFPLANDWKEKNLGKQYDKRSGDFRYLSTSSKNGFDTNSRNLPAMWEHYAESSSGVCIGFEVSMLKSICHHYGYVTYEQGLSNTDCSLEEYVMRKNSNWSYENEYRFVWTDIDRRSTIRPITPYISEIIFGPNLKVKDIVEILNQNTKAFCKIAEEKLKICMAMNDGFMSAQSYTIFQNIYNHYGK